jgi:hypothetical protein
MPLVLLPSWDPFVGAHPVGDGLAMAVHMQSPTGVGSYEQPPKQSPLVVYQF